MFTKLFALLLLIFIVSSIHSHHHHLDEHDFGTSKGTKGRTYEEVCVHYDGVICNRIPGIGSKCCKKGRFSSKVCDTFGCEHDTLSISNMDWDY